MENSSTSTVQYSTLRVSLPELVGSRQAAERIARSLAEDLSSTVVVLDCSEVRAAAQGFTDEICKQLLEAAQAAGLVLYRPPMRMANHALRSAESRLLEGLEVVSPRELSSSSV